MSRIDSDIDLDEVPFLEPDATASTIAADPVSVPNDGTTPITLTVTVRADGGSIIANRAVTIVLTDTGDAVIGPMPGETDENGQVSIDITNETAETLTIGFTLNGDNSPSVVEVEFETAQRYPLDATPQEIINIGGTPFPIRPDDFSAEWDAISTAFTNRFAFPTGIPATAQVLDFNTGKKLVELLIQEAPLSGPDVNNMTAGGVSMQISIFNPFAALPVQGTIGVNISRGENDIPTRGVTTWQASTFSESISATPLAGNPDVTGKTIAVGVDTDTDEFVFFYDGSELGRLDAPANVEDVYIFINGVDISTNGSNIVGETFSIRFNDIASEIQGVYPSPWTDTNGVPVS